jgi:hypothetical protein
MIVRRFDGLELGTVAFTSEDGLLVDEGLVLPRQYTTSFDQVDRVEGRDVYLKRGAELLSVESEAPPQKAAS